MLLLVRGKQLKYFYLFILCLALPFNVLRAAELETISRAFHIPTCNFLLSHPVAPPPVGNFRSGAAFQIRAANPDFSPTAVENFRSIVKEAQARGVANKRQPLLLHHGKKTAISVLLIHGMSGSPEGMMQEALDHFAAGHNVVVILLDGHGTRPEDQGNITLSGLRRNVDRGVEIARELGDQLLVMGYSLGGALSLDLYQRNPQVVSGLQLVAPAFAMNSNLKTLVQMALERLNRDPQMSPLLGDVSDNGDVFSELTYTKTHARMFEVFFELSEGLNLTDPLKIPVVIVAGSKDRRIDLEAVRSFIEANKFSPTQVFLLDEIDHGTVVTTPDDPLPPLLFENTQGIFFRDRLAPLKKINALLGRPAVATTVEFEEARRIIESLRK